MSATQTATTEQRPAGGPCPRCGEPLPAAAYFEVLPAPPEHLPAWRLRHKRRDGQTCIVYVGPRREPGAAD